MKLNPLFWFTTLAFVFAVAGCSPPANTSASTTGTTGDAKPTSDIKIGYIVKQPEERWFQIETMFAKKCGKDKGFEVIALGAGDGDKVMAAIDNLNAQGAKGFVICTPDTKLGTAIAKKAESLGMKFMTVDDQFVDADGKTMTNVHHMGLAAEKIGQLSGETLLALAKEKKFPMDKIGVCLITHEELDTARVRTDNIHKALIAGGIKESQILKAPQKTTDVPGGMEAADILLTQHPEVKYWLVAAMNDTGVIGAVRSMEHHGFTPDNCIGVGINGTEAVAEFEKEKPTSVMASILMRCDRHGYDSTEMVYKWIKDGTEPPLDTRTEGMVVSRADYKKQFADLGIPIE